MTQITKQTPLVVGGISVKQKEKLYCLNDLHKAAGGERRHEISNWMMLKSTSEEVEYLSGNTVIPVFKKVAGRNGGTYVSKDLVYSYAMWVSPRFKFTVIQAYDSLVNDEIEKAKEIASRVILKDDYLPMTDALQQHRLEEGKATKGYHYSNEADMINQIMTGMKAKQFKVTFHVDSVRDNLTGYGKKAMISLQRANTSLIEMSMDYQSRKGKLTELVKTKWDKEPLLEQALMIDQVAA